MQVEDVRGPIEEPHPDLRASSVDQKSLLVNVGGREIKDKLTELFTPNKRKSRSSSDTRVSAASAEKKRDHGHSGHLDWSAGYMPRGKAEISEACRQAFIATCHLLLECTTFPIYLSEEETLAFHIDMFGHTGQRIDVCVNTAVSYPTKRDKWLTTLLFHQVIKWTASQCGWGP